MIEFCNYFGNIGVIFRVIMIKILSIFLLAYLIGNFSPAFIVGKLAGGVDIRQKGSGNAGATNVLRSLGWKYGLLVFVLDALKGVAAALAGLALGGNAGLAAASFGVILGHDFPALLNFHGGKGIAATIGIFLSLLPVPTLIGILILVVVVLLTKMVSVGSLVFVVSMAGYTLLSGQPLVLVVVAVGMAFFAILRHRTNIKRILAGVENKISI